IIGITGTKDLIDDLAARYGVGYRIVKQDSATNYVVDHTSETYVIDTNGDWVDTLPHAAPPEDIIKSIMALTK
ncbi:MAG: SCO family protein, partial [Gammaproteobacteria bacterium]|nr:SCO family protein [Gammaproteobacteria bacterium]